MRPQFKIEFNSWHDKLLNLMTQIANRLIIHEVIEPRTIIRKILNLHPRYTWKNVKNFYFMSCDEN